MLLEIRNASSVVEVAEERMTKAAKVDGLAAAYPCKLYGAGLTTDLKKHPRASKMQTPEWILQRLKSLESDESSYSHGT